MAIGHGSQSPSSSEPFTWLYVPGGHFSQSVTEVPPSFSENVPSGHRVQVSNAPAENVPALQMIFTSLMMLLQEYPGMHSVQKVCPPREKVPGAQSAMRVALDVDGHAWPGGQNVHRPMPRVA